MSNMGNAAILACLCLRASIGDGVLGGGAKDCNITWIVTCTSRFITAFFLGGGHLKVGSDYKINHQIRNVKLRNRMYLRIEEIRYVLFYW